jgi:uncharacterized protein YggE
MMRRQGQVAKAVWAGRVAMALLPALIYGQVSNNSVTVTASQTISAQPDQAIFSVAVDSGFDKNLSDIVGALPSVGIAAPNFVGLSIVQQMQVKGAAPPPVEWDFQLPVPIAKVKDTTAALSGLTETIAQNNSGLSLSFTVIGTQVSSQQSTGCSLAGLLTQARTQAQQLTSAAGLTVGAIQRIMASTPGTCFLTVQFAVGTAAPANLNAITISASRPVAVQADEVSLQLNVTSDVSAGLDDITAALQQAGLSGAVFTGVSTATVYVQSPAPPQSQLRWSFTLTAPLARIKDTFTALLAAQQALANGSPALGLSFYGGQTLISPQLQQSLTCPDADLLHDAQTEAQSIAAAAGVSVGPVLSMGGGGAPALGLLPAARLGDFSIASVGTIVNGVIANFANNIQQSCSMTVAFVLG